MALIICPECGKRFSEYAENCPECGFPTSEIPIVIKCPECGNHFSNDVECCPNCGFPTNEINPNEHGEPIRDFDSVEEGGDKRQSTPSTTEQMSSSMEFHQSKMIVKKKEVNPFGYFVLAVIAIVGITFYYGFKGSDSGSHNQRTYYQDSSQEKAKKDYSWIVGTWYVQFSSTEAISIRFTGDGSRGDVTELEDALNAHSAKYGTYYVEDDVLYYKIDGEPVVTTIDIHDGNKLYFGGGYYYKKIKR